MRLKLTWILTSLLAGALALPAQQGQGGPPLAFNDKDKDGICDVTGKPVGQRMGAAAAARRGRMGMKGRAGRGMGQCRFATQQQRDTSPPKADAPASPNTGERNQP